MAIKVIVELQARPGYEVLDNPDVLVEIAEWESVEARQTHMQEAAATGAYTPLLAMLAAPFRVTVIRPLS